MQSNAARPQEAVGHESQFGPIEEEIDSNWDEDIETFDGMMITEELLRGIYEFGFENPSPIQKRAICPMIIGRDLIIQAPTGTGHTGIFAIGALAKVDPKLRQCQSLIIMPGREYSYGTQRLMQSIGTYMNLAIHACTGARTVQNDIQNLQAGVHIVVGTPYRVYDLISRRALLLDSIRQVIIPEADRLFAIFKDKVYDIFKYLPEEVQVCLFSGSESMSLDVLEATQRLMREPVRVSLVRNELKLDRIKQFYIDVQGEEWKYDTLLDLYKVIPNSRSIVYCNIRRKVDWLHDKMQNLDFAVLCLHEDMDQRERDLIMQEFRSSSSCVLITMDIFPRSKVDLSQISLVINFDLPTYRERYICRVGHHSRFRGTGVAINFLTGEDIHYLRDIEQFYTTEITKMPMNIADLI